MNRLRRNIYKVLFVIPLSLSLPVFGASSYHASVSCKAVRVTLVNQSQHSVHIVGQDKSLVFESLSHSSRKTPKSSPRSAVVAPKSFYNKRCMLELKVNGKTKRGLIKATTSSNERLQVVDVHVSKEGKIRAAGDIHRSGFEMESYIAWHGMAAVMTGGDASLLGEDSDMLG